MLLYLTIADRPYPEVVMPCYAKKQDTYSCLLACPSPQRCSWFRASVRGCAVVEDKPAVNARGRQPEWQAVKRKIGENQYRVMSDTNNFMKAIFMAVFVVGAVPLPGIVQCHCRAQCLDCTADGESPFWPSPSGRSTRASGVSWYPTEWSSRWYSFYPWYGYWAKSLWFSRLILIVNFPKSLTFLCNETLLEPTDQQSKLQHSRRFLPVHPE